MADQAAQIAKVSQMVKLQSMLCQFDTWACNLATPTPTTGVASMAYDVLFN